MKIGIHRRAGEPVHTGGWSGPWKATCDARGIQSEFIDLLSPTAPEKIQNFDILLYHLGNYKWSDMQHARSILRAAKAAGLLVFPDDPDAWHFDDKIAQSYLLSALEAPIPCWKVFHSQSEYVDWLSTEPKYPFVAKLRAGSGSHHVSLVEGPDEAKVYGNRMFGPGIHPQPNLAFKTRSNLFSARSLGQIISRARRIPEFLRTRRNAMRLGVEQGYVYVQEFVPNGGYDIKVAVVNGKTSFLVRNVRPGDFRASGGGDLFHDRSVVPASVVVAAQQTAIALGSLCMGFDFVVDSRTGEPAIVEMSYGFSHQAILEAGGYWDADGNWVDEPLDVPCEIIMALLARADRTSGARSPIRLRSDRC